MAFEPLNESALPNLPGARPRRTADRARVAVPRRIGDGRPRALLEPVRRDEPAARGGGRRHERERREHGACGDEPGQRTAAAGAATEPGNQAVRRLRARVARTTTVWVAACSHVIPAHECASARPDVRGPVAGSYPPRRRAGRLSDGPGSGQPSGRDPSGHAACLRRTPAARTRRGPCIRLPTPSPTAPPEPQP